MSEVFLKTAVLGQLTTIEIYEEFDGPKFFCVRNNSGKTFLVYWCDYNYDSEGWLLLPISSKKLDALRQKEFSVNHAYSTPEEYYFLLYCNYGGHEPNHYIFIDPKDINPELLPPDEIFIEHVSVVETGEFNWDHEVKLKKISGAKTTPNSDVASDVLKKWTNLVEGTMDIFTKGQSLHFASALPGSLEMKFGSTNSDNTYRAIDSIFKTLQKVDSSKLINELYEVGIEPRKLYELCELIRNHNLEMTVYPRNGASAINLGVQNTEKWLEKLLPLSSSILSTDKIPQANEIEKILRILDTKSQGKPITTESISVTTPRQVSYYLDAAINLGVLNESYHITSIGKFIVSRTTTDEKYAVLANCFESSDCGISWMEWSSVNHLPELQEETAEKFLLETAPGLSENTAKRRASTLRKWLAKLRPYHVKYKEN